jgi:hypothetical protein
MYRLKLLIVFLLVGFKSFSQTAILKDSVVVLTEKQARAVAKDLVHLDAANQIIKEQESRIKNFQRKEIEFKNQLDIKDSIIKYQKEIIDINKEIIKNKKPFEIHGYAGVQTTQFTLREPTLYTNLMLEFTRFNIGAQYFVQPNNPPGYSVVLEYKLF